MNYKLTRKENKEINDCVNRYFRMKRKRVFRKTAHIILYPITYVRKLKS